MELRTPNMFSGVDVQSLTGDKLAESLARNVTTLAIFSIRPVRYLSELRLDLPASLLESVQTTPAALLLIASVGEWLTSL